MTEYEKKMESMDKRIKELEKALNGLTKENAALRRASEKGARELVPFSVAVKYAARKGTDHGNSTLSDFSFLRSGDVKVLGKMVRSALFKTERTVKSGESAGEYWSYTPTVRDLDDAQYEQYGKMLDELLAIFQKYNSGGETSTDEKEPAAMEENKEGG